MRNPRPERRSSPMSEAKTAAQPQAEARECSDFGALLSKEFKPKSDHAQEAIQSAVKTLAAQALESSVVVSNDVVNTIAAIIAEIDRKLTEQVNLILHHPDFQQLEGAWRGLSYLVNNTETDEMLKIRVRNLSNKELAKTLRKFKGTAWDQTPIFQKIYEEEDDQFGSYPYDLLHRH